VYLNSFLYYPCVSPMKPDHLVQHCIASGWYRGPSSRREDRGESFGLREGVTGSQRRLAGGDTTAWLET
jgi:hypothetical protein